MKLESNFNICFKVVELRTEIKNSLQPRPQFKLPKSANSQLFRQSAIADLRTI